MRKNRESGQALVLVLLSLSVVLTVVLFGLSRSVNDISTSTQQSDSVRAFSAAEAGIENALITGLGGSSALDSSTSYDVQVTSGGSSTFNYQESLSSGSVMTLWFVSHDTDGNIVCDAAAGKPCFTGDSLRVCWGSDSSVSGYTPAIEVSVYYKASPASTDFSSVRVARATYDPNSTRRATENSFDSALISSCDIGGKLYAFQKDITLSALGGAGFNNAGLLFAKVRMLYNTTAAHPIGFSVSSGALPVQGLEIYSTGVSGVGDAQSNRRIYVFQSWPEFPFSGFSIFYPDGIVK